MSTIFHSSTKHAQLKTKRKKREIILYFSHAHLSAFQKLFAQKDNGLIIVCDCHFLVGLFHFARENLFFFEYPIYFSLFSLPPNSPPLINTIKISPERINRPQFRKNFILTLIAWQRQNKRQERESLQMASARGHTGLLR